MLMVRGLKRNKASEHLTVNDLIGSEQEGPEGVCVSLLFIDSGTSEGRVSKLGLAYAMLAIKWETPVAYVSTLGGGEQLITSCLKNSSGSMA